MVHEREGVVTGRLGAAQRHVGQVEDPERARECHGQLDADRCERVRGSEVVTNEGVVPDDLDRIAHPSGLTGRELSGAVARGLEGREQGGSHTVVLQFANGGDRRATR